MVYILPVAENLELRCSPKATALWIGNFGVQLSEEPCVETKNTERLQGQCRYRLRLIFGIDQKGLKRVVRTTADGNSVFFNDARQVFCQFAGIDKNYRGNVILFPIFLLVSPGLSWSLKDPPLVAIDCEGLPNIFAFPISVFFLSDQELGNVQLNVENTPVSVVCDDWTGSLDTGRWSEWLSSGQW